MSLRHLSEDELKRMIEAHQTTLSVLMAELSARKGQQEPYVLNDLSEDRVTTALDTYYSTPGTFRQAMRAALEAAFMVQGDIWVNEVTVYTGGKTITGPVDNEAREFIRQAKIIQAIKRVREVTGLGLGEAKALVDYTRDTYARGEWK